LRPYRRHRRFCQQTEHHFQRRPKLWQEWVMSMGTAGVGKRERLRLKARRINCFGLGELENPFLE
jgi:hypothetical protein